MTVEFTRTEHPNPASGSRRSEILSAPGFGNYFTDHMVSIDWHADRGWHDAAVVPYGPISLDPSAMVLHYAQEIFEGLKAYRQADGTIASFRPDANARRLNNSARRLAMPELPEDVFLGSLRALLGVRPSNSYRYLVIASPAGAYFPGGVKPVSVWLSSEYVRAAPGGIGDAKTGGNYAASLLAQAQAAEHGCEQVVWLDAVERRFIEEMGGMNLFFVLGSGADARLVTPELSGSLLPGVTRDSLLALSVDAGIAVEERKVSSEELRKGVASGDITEVFACGTAAVITPVGRVKGDSDDYQIGDGKPGEVTTALRDTLTGIQRGTFADTHGWMTELYRP